MPKTSTDRSRICRGKLSEDFERYNFYKSKDRERKRAERSKPNIQSSAKIAQQKKLRDHVRKCRILKKAKEKSASAPVEQGEAISYSTPQALGKAVGKVKPHLPKSPRKRKAVIVKLASSSGIELSKKKNKQASNETPACRQKL